MLVVICRHPELGEGWGVCCRFTEMNEGVEVKAERGRFPKQKNLNGRRADLKGTNERRGIQ